MSRRLPTAELETTGLSTEEAGRRLVEVGANEIQRAQRTSRWRLLARIGIHQIPTVARLFHLQDLPLERRALPFRLALIPVTVLELRKLVQRSA